MDHSKRSFRLADISSVVAMLTLAGMVWAMYSKPAQWDQTSKDMEKIGPTVAQHTTQLAILDERTQQILILVRAINKNTR